MILCAVGMKPFNYFLFHVKSRMGLENRILERV